ncbi:MAG: hypothetical protein V1862_02155 [Methanobacteriota archaeon]
MDNEHPSVCPPSSQILWANEIKILLDAIDEGLSGKARHIAIISEYLAGKEDLATKVECIHSGRTTRIRFESFVDDISVLSNLPENEIYIVENCHFLAQRKIDGFHILRQFIELVSQKNQIWVTTWNIHSWRYLSAVQGISSLFPVQITLPQKNYGKLRDFILSQHTSSVFYVIDTPVPRRLIMVQKNLTFEVPFFHDTYSMMIYGIRFRLIWAMLRGKSHEVEPDELIFQRLAQISNGNPGIALHIWEKSLEAWEIRMSTMSPPPLNGVMDPDTAYILSMLLSLETVSIQDLQSVTPQEINLNLILAHLEDKKIIAIKETHITIEPLAFAGITTELQKIRMVW